MKNKQAFTLIELLVVVLIIGILSAIALPQYQKAVEKAKAVQSIAVIKTLAQAAEVYYLENGTYPTKFDELTANIDWPEKQVSGMATYTKDSLSNGEWSFELYDDSAANSNQRRIFSFRLKGPYQGAGFVIGIGTDPKAGKIQCVERVSNGALIFKGNPGDYCQKIMGGVRDGGEVNRYYNLP